MYTTPAPVMGFELNRRDVRDTVRRDLASSLLSSSLLPSCQSKSGADLIRKRPIHASIMRRSSTRSCGSDTTATSTTFAGTTGSSRSLDFRDTGSFGHQECKHVSFADELVSLVANSEQQLSPEEVEALWWTADDFIKFRKFCRRESNKAKEISALITGFELVYEGCKSGNIFRQIKALSEHGTACEPPSPVLTQRTVSLRDCIQIIGTPYRGMELAIFPHLYKDRQAHSKTFLSIQAKLPESMSLSEREIVLAAKSRFLSRRTRSLARLYAATDEVMAEVVHRERGGAK